jgi:hypothetical protein
MRDFQYACQAEAREWLHNHTKGWGRCCRRLGERAEVLADCGVGRDATH